MTMGGGGQQPSRPMLQATRLWRKTSAKGEPYLVGRLGNVRVLVFQRREGDGEEGDHTHTLMFAQADPPQAKGKTALAERNEVAREIQREQKRIAERRAMQEEGR